MIFRILFGAGIACLSYYLGREVARAAPVRRRLRTARAGATQRLTPARPRPPSAPPQDTSLH